MRRRIALALALLALAVLASALPQRRVQQHLALGEAPLCRPGAALGRVRVAAEFAWRADQKEPALREAIAARALRASFADLPCARAVEFADDAAELAGVDTLVVVRVHELGPNLIATLIPPQWIGWTEVDVLVRAVRPADGAVLLDAHASREQGGPFVLRGIAPLEAELVAALAPLIGGAAVR